MHKLSKTYSMLSNIVIAKLFILKILENTIKVRKTVKKL